MTIHLTINNTGSYSGPSWVVEAWENGEYSQFPRLFEHRQEAVNFANSLAISQTENTKFVYKGF